MAAVRGDADRDDDGLGHDPVTDPGFAIGGVEEHVGEVLGGEGAVAELGNFRIQARADPGHFRLGDSSVSAEGFDEVVDLAGRDAVNIGLHHHSEEGLVDATAPLQECGEERASAQLRDLQIEVSGGGGQRSGSDPVAVGGAIAAAFEWGGADERARFRVDQLLIERLGRDPDPVGDIGELQLGKQVEQGRLV